MSDIPNAYNLNSPPALTPPRDSSASELDRLRRELAEMKADARALARECEAWAAWEKSESLVGTEDEVDVNANNAWDWLQECRKATDDRNAMRWAKQQPTP